MSRVLLLGYNPPQLVRGRKIEAAHYRTWQFLQPLLEDGHSVCLCGGSANEPVAEEQAPAEWQERLQVRPIAYGRRGWMRALQEAHDDFEPDCIVAVNFSHCLYSTKLKTSRPIWMDIYGEVMTIMQAAFYRTQSDRGLPTTLAYMRQVLQRGDVFSGCGIPQQHALAGELAMVGRLNRHTFGYDFVRAILPGAPPRENGSGPAQAFDRRTLLEQYNIGADDFVVLWCGGYNAWTDVHTLFTGLERAMDKNPHIHYLSAGANSYRAVDNVYAQLLEMIADSPHRERFHMLGWQPWNDIAKFYAVSDVGLNIDSEHYETIYGTRTRLVEMMAANLAVVTTLGSELSYILQKEDAALTFEIGDALQLAANILALADDPCRGEAVREKAASLVDGMLSFSNTTLPLREWVRAPRRAPDYDVPENRLRTWEYQARAFARQGLWQLFGQDK